jgi:hypothetical protein
MLYCFSKDIQPPTLKCPPYQGPGQWPAERHAERGVEPERDKPSGWKRGEAGFQTEKVRSSPSKQQGTGRPPRRRSPSHALVEFLVRFRLGEGITRASFFVEKDGLDFVLFPQRGAACRGNPRRRAWLADVPQNPLYRGRLGHEGNNPHLGPTLGAVCRILSHLEEWPVTIYQIRFAARRNP